MARIRLQIAVSVHSQIYCDSQGAEHHYSWDKKKKKKTTTTTTTTTQQQWN